MMKIEQGEEGEEEEEEKNVLVTPWMRDKLKYVNPWRPEVMSAGQCNPGFLSETTLSNCLPRFCAIQRGLPHLTF